MLSPLLLTSHPVRCDAMLHGCGTSPVCLSYAIKTLFQSYHGGDMMYEMRSRKPKPALLTTQGIFNLPHHIGMQWEELVFDDTVSYTQRGKAALLLLANTVASRRRAEVGMCCHSRGYCFITPPLEHAFKVKGFTGYSCADCTEGANLPFALSFFNSFGKRFIHMNTYFLNAKALVFEPLTWSHLLSTLWWGIGMGCILCSPPHSEH